MHEDMNSAVHVGRGCVRNFGNDVSGISRSSRFGGLRNALLISATAGALLFACNTFAGAQGAPAGASTNDPVVLLPPIVPPAFPCDKEFIGENGVELNTRLCEGDVSRGVVLGGVDNSYNKLVVRGLTGNITPADGIHGVSFTTTDTRNIDIDVDTESYKILTTEADAHGIFGSAKGADTLLTINHQGDIETTGENAHGIVGKTNGGDVTINLNGKSSIKSNHATTGTGVKFDGSGRNSLNIDPKSEVTIFGGQYDVWGRSGAETITNKGVLTALGVIDLGLGDNAFNNMDGAVFNSGREVVLGTNNLNVNNLFQNEGRISPGGNDTIQTTKITGDFTQLATGIYTVTFDPSAKADQLDITGMATLGGTLKVVRTGSTSFSQTLELLVMKADQGFTGEFANMGNLLFGVTRVNEQANANEFWIKVEKGPCNAVELEITCDGNFPGGVRFDDSDGDYTKLVIKGLDENIVPDDGKTGVSLTTRSNKNIDIDVNTGVHKIVTKGDYAHGIIGVSGGGTVSINHKGDIETAERIAHGIYGRSNGGAVSIDHNGNIKTAGERARGISGYSKAGTVNITHEGDIETAGEGARGISGYSKAGTVNITLNGKSSVESSHTSGIGVRFLGDGKNSLNINGEVTIFGGQYDVWSDGGGDTTITNKGVFTARGVIDLGTGANAFNNEINAVFNSGREVVLGANNLNVNNKFQNDGRISPGGDGKIKTTIITGDFTQSATGSYAVTFNPSVAEADKQADLLEITGEATLGGKLKVVKTGDAPFTPGLELLVMKVSGEITEDFSNMYTTNPFFGVERFDKQNADEYRVQVIQGPCRGVGEVTCTGNLPGGVRFDDPANDYTKLIVRDLSTNIAPDEGEDGVVLTTRSNRNIDIDVNTEEYKIVTKGNNTVGIGGFSAGGGTVSINHKGDITTIGSAVGIFGGSTGGAVSITHEGNIETAGADAYGIVGGSDRANGGTLSITLKGNSSIKSNHATTGTGVRFSGNGKNSLNIAPKGEVTIFGGQYDVYAEGGGDETIKNEGVFTALGVINLGRGDNAFNNMGGAVFNSGSEVNLGMNNPGVNDLFTNNGEISPGRDGEIQTTRISGNFEQSATGIYTVTFDPSAEVGKRADLLDITGAAELGGKLKIVLSTNYQVQGVSQLAEYLIMKADGGVTGTFAKIANAKLSTSNLRYDANNVYLNLKDVGPDELAELLTELLPEEGVSVASIIPSIHGVLISQGQRTIDLINSRLQIAHADDTGEAATLRLTSGTLQSSRDKRFWISVHGAKGKHDATPVSPGLRTRQTGLTAGFDHQVSKDLRLGVMASYGKTDFKQKAIENSSKDRTVSLGGYGSFTPPSSPLRIGFGGIYNWHRIRSSRLVNPPGASSHYLSASYKARSWQVFGEASWRIEMSNTLSLEPFAGLAYTKFKSGSFTETGGDEVLKASSSNRGNTFSTVGVRGSLKLDETVRLYGMAGWRRAFGDINPSLQFTDTDGNFSLGFGSVIARDAGLVQIGAVFALSPSASLSISYTGQYAKKAKTHGGNLKLNVAF